MKQRTILLPAALRRYCIPTLLVALFWATGSGAAFAQTTHSINSGNVTITANGTYTITGSTTGNRIVVATGVTANITLNGVNIDLSATGNACAFDIASGATVHLTLAGNSVLKSGDNKPAIFVPINAALNISGNGSLEAVGGEGGAGIGGDEGPYDGGYNPPGPGGSCGSVNISSGTVTAIGQGGGAGIGGGQGGSTYDDFGGNGGTGGTVTITGGTVTAIGNGGAGIGGGQGGDCQRWDGGNGGTGGTVIITGGTVTATGNDGGAGIGGGEGGSGSGGAYTAPGGSGGTVTITGGSLNASSIQTPPQNSEPRNVYLNTLTVGSSVVANTAITAGHINGTPCTPDGVGGYGIHDVKTDASGKVYFYLPASSGSESVMLKTLATGSAQFEESYPRTTSNSDQATLQAQYAVSLSPVGTYTFPSASYGSAPASLGVTVTGMGNNPTGDLDVALDDVSAFTLSTSSMAALAVGGTGNFTVTPKTGLNAGTYTATVTVSNANINASFNVSFTVGKLTLTAAHLAYDLSAVTYTGAPQGIAPPRLKSPLAGGNITVKYNGGTTAPVNAGTYAVTVDVKNVAGCVDITGLSLGDFVINRAVPTAEYLDFTLPDIIYDGEFHSVPVTPKEGVVGLGDITVRYNGHTGRPDEDGAYTVTVEIAGNDNYEAVTLSLGAFAIYRPPVPEIRRTVTLAPSPYYDISPAPGVYRIASGRDMVLTLTPLATLPAGHVPQVTTGRRILADDEGGITVESNADGTYTVHIHRIQETTAVTVTATAVSSGVTSSGSLPAARVWSYGKQLFITASVSDRAQVYNAGGRLVKLLPTVAGETVTQSLPPGIYLIATEGKSYRVVITE